MIVEIPVPDLLLYLIAAYGLFLLLKSIIEFLPFT